MGHKCQRNPNIIILIILQRITIRVTTLQTNRLYLGKRTFKPKMLQISFQINLMPNKMSQIFTLKKLLANLIRVNTVIIRVFCWKILPKRVRMVKVVGSPWPKWIRFSTLSTKGRKDLQTSKIYSNFQNKMNTIKSKLPLSWAEIQTIFLDAYRLKKKIRDPLWFLTKAIYNDWKTNK